MSHQELSFGMKFDSKIDGQKTGIFWNHSFRADRLKWNIYIQYESWIL